MTNDTDIVLMKPYEYYYDNFKESTASLLETYPNVDDILLGGDENYLKDFVIIFRQMIRALVSLNTFVEFDFDEADLGIDYQSYLDYLSKYKELSTLSTKADKTSILSDIDFCLEFLRNDRINVQYIIDILADIIKTTNEVKRQKSIEELRASINESSNDLLVLKVELINKFINNVVPTLSPDDSVTEKYEQFMEQEKEDELENLSKKYSVSIDEIIDVISDYEFSGFIPTSTLKSKIPNEIYENYKKENQTTSIRAKNEVATIFKEKIIELTNRFI